MLPISTAMPAPFAALPEAVLQQRAPFGAFFLTPFRDIDDRAFIKAAAGRTERLAREAAKSDAVGSRRR
jgi:hypothetical protein